MQNKPNFDKGQNKPNPLYKKDLRKFYTPSDNEKQTQNKANLLNAQMNLNFYSTEDYKNKRLCRRGENKPNQTQFQTQLSVVCHLSSVRHTLPAKRYLIFPPLAFSADIHYKQQTTNNEQRSTARLKGRWTKIFRVSLINVFWVRI